MVSNVHQLPDPGHRSWRVYEKVLREVLAQDLDAVELEHVVGVVRVAYLQYATYDHVVPEADDPQAVFDALNVWMRRVCSGLLVSLAGAELRAYRAERAARE